MRDQIRNSESPLASLPDTPVFKRARRSMMANERLQTHRFKTPMRYRIEMQGFLADSLGQRVGKA